MVNIKTKKCRLSKYFTFSLLIAAFLYALINAIIIWNYSDKDERTTADVAIVLGAGLSDGKVTPVFQQRINHGIFLYQNGYVKKLIFTGGFGEGNEHSDAWVAKQYAEQQGVPAQDILYEETSTITQENIRYAKAIMDDGQYQSAIIVSDPLHMKRAMLIAKDAGIKAWSSPTPTTMYISFKNKMEFLARETFFYSLYKIHR
ncbi:YdcF family protein [Budviciaceae bacterium CWB-B4]|uniref:YdcF family protein n=1 Tax=Limnobaculum xujianqingii TaxID=2738837 RepID=A0A9D7FU76_9GAMM|nr:YdcF family protein [Limnobaculum xujianqingii]MBK5073400.1 YdcF family protein [Limnobaculum xujianqingii]MBK5176869.1 YdcF family protein [Limnobaculum xujianqingii]